MRALLMSVLVIVLVSSPAIGVDEGWPREISSTDGTVVIYQPQIESFAEIELEARVALAVITDELTAPVFGAVWIVAVVKTDRDARTVTILDVDIKRVRFPEASADLETRLTDLLEREIPTWKLELSLDRLIADLEGAELRENESEGLNNEPPKIIVSNQPALLVVIDGEPILGALEGSSLQRVLNTPYLLVKDRGSYYLAAGERWFVTETLDGLWRLDKKPPREVADLAESTSNSATESSDMPIDDRVPRIVVSFGPTELIFIDGPPNLTPLADTDLLYVKNTDSDVLLDIQTQAYYLLLSGRWFSSATLAGPWAFVAADELPGYFAKIPLDSENGHLLASVAGTEQAQDAILDASIPQTAAVKRDASLTVEYDGEPRFATIAGTAVAYALNSPSSVLLISETYYCCDEAVWYESISPYGPWKVSVLVPNEVATIPPTSPVYNVTYVKVYHSTPEVVYVGYTPGYMGSYIYRGTVVYGTGWHYRPWYGRHYYPRPHTWGFHARYNPWHGWNFGWSYCNSPFYLTVGWQEYNGWWGPAFYYRYPPHAYRYGARHGYRQGYWHGYRAGNGQVNVGATRPPRGRSAAGVISGNRNIYERPNNSSRVVSTREHGQQRRPEPSHTRQNNVYTDPSGNIYRRNTDGSWDRRQSGNWQRSEGARDSSGPATRTDSRPGSGRPPTKPGSESVQQGERRGAPISSTRPTAPAGPRPSTKPDPRSSRTRSLETDHSARQRGEQRTTTYQRSDAPRAGKPPAKESTAAKSKADTTEKKPKGKKKR